MYEKRRTLRIDFIAGMHLIYLHHDGHSYLPVKAIVCWWHRIRNSFFTLLSSFYLICIIVKKFRICIDNHLISNECKNGNVAKQIFSGPIYHVM